MVGATIYISTGYEPRFGIAGALDHMERRPVFSLLRSPYASYTQCVWYARKKALLKIKYLARMWDWSDGIGQEG